LFSTSYERSNSANTRIAHEKNEREGASKKKKMYPPKYKKSSTQDALTHSLIHCLPKEHTIQQQQQFNSTSYGRSILIFAEYKRENR
jgi:hypothetical protein